METRVLGVWHNLGNLHEKYCLEQISALPKGSVVAVEISKSDLKNTKNILDWKSKRGYNPSDFFQSVILHALKNGHSVLPID